MLEASTKLAHSLTGVFGQNGMGRSVQIYDCWIHNPICYAVIIYICFHYFFAISFQSCTYWWDLLSIDWITLNYISILTFFKFSISKKVVELWIWHKSSQLMSSSCFLQYRDTVRQFIKGTDGFAGAFAECLCGSPNLYQVYLLSLVTIAFPFWI